MHRPRPHLGVVGLLDEAAARGPVLGKFQDQRLEVHGLSGRERGEIGAVTESSRASAPRHEPSARLPRKRWLFSSCPRNRRRTSRGGRRAPGATPRLPRRGGRGRRAATGGSRRGAAAPHRRRERPPAGRTRSRRAPGARRRSAPLRPTGPARRKRTPSRPGGVPRAGGATPRSSAPRGRRRAPASSASRTWRVSRYASGAGLGLGQERRQALGDVRQEHRRLGARGEAEGALHELEAVGPGEVRPFLLEERHRDLREDLEKAPRGGTAAVRRGGPPARRPRRA